MATEKPAGVSVLEELISLLMSAWQDAKRPKQRRALKCGAFMGCMWDWESGNRPRGARGPAASP